MTLGFDMWSLLPHSVHGELLHHRCCRPPEAQEQESETKVTVIHTNNIFNIICCVIKSKKIQKNAAKSNLALNYGS